MSQQLIRPLLVDDDPDTVELMQWMLKDAAKDPIVATSGQDALKLYEENQQNIDIIISDILMPELNGHELLEEIRKSNPTIPFYFASGAYEHMEEYEEQTKNSSVTGILTKPFVQEQIEEAISRALKYQVAQAG